MTFNKDRNFDDLADRFEQRIYDSQKGQWRLHLLKQDLQSVLAAEKALSVWDAGCGFAQISQWLAGLGHRVSACDLSGKMLAKARQSFAEQALDADFIQGAFQDLAADQAPVNLVISHAVLEWLAEPLAGLDVLLGKVATGGFLSLMFYNRNAMVYKNVLQGQWRLKPIIEDSYLGKGDRLSPPNPLFPHEVERYLVGAGFELVQHTGIRVFSDYLPATAMQGTSPDELNLLEERYCRLPVYRDMGRYVHMLAIKKPA